MMQNFYEVKMASYDDPKDMERAKIQAENLNIKTRLQLHIQGMKTGETQQRQLEHAQAEAKKAADIVIAGMPEGYGEWA